MRGRMGVIGRTVPSAVDKCKSEAARRVTSFEAPSATFAQVSLEERQMKSLIIRTFLFAVAQAYAAPAAVPHFDLDMTHAEYDAALSTRGTRDVTDDLQVILDTGKHFYEWVDHINSF